MNNLSLYGWNTLLSEQKQSTPYSTLFHGRVTVAHKTCYEVVAADGHYLCELTGNMLYARSPEEYPCTGDWVIIQPTDHDKGLIIDLLPRNKTLYRKKSGTVSTRQAVAVHVDKAFIVQSLDANFNVRRIERFMVQIEEEGIIPALVLTKADLDFDYQYVMQALNHLSGKIEVFITSIHLPEKIDALRQYIQPGETVVFTGSSGVGKSSLINALCGREVLETSAISDWSGKGKHTSTRREMVLLESGGVLIDTPGMREFGVTFDNADTLSSVFDISEWEGECRFPDCRHLNEPDCAVIRAVDEGRMDRSAYESYLKLRREAWHFSASEHEKRKRDKAFNKMVKEVKKKRY